MEAHKTADVKLDVREGVREVVRKAKVGGSGGHHGVRYRLKLSAHSGGFFRFAKNATLSAWFPTFPVSSSGMANHSNQSLPGCLPAVIRQICNFFFKRLKTRVYLPAKEVNKTRSDPVSAESATAITASAPARPPSHSRRLRLRRRRSLVST